MESREALFWSCVFREKVVPRGRGSERPISVSRKIGLGLCVLVPIQSCNDGSGEGMLSLFGVRNRGI